MTTTQINQALFSAAVNNMSAGELSTLRSDAAKLFANSGFPTVKDENWKYTNLEAAATLSNEWLAALQTSPLSNDGPTPMAEEHLVPRHDIDADWIIVRNGVADSASIEQLELPAGVSVSLIDADGAAVALATDTPLSAFNAALLKDGICVRVANNVSVERPIGFLIVDDDKNQVTQLRVLFEIGENAALRVVDYALSSSVGAKFTNTVTQVELATGARADIVRVQAHALDHLSTNRLVAKIGKDATFTHNNFDLGGDLTRNDITAVIEGTGAEVNLSGLYLASGNQHIDNHTRVEHRVGPSVSHEEYRGILNDKSRCVFNGQAVVFEGADGTDANQANHNLLLSDQAEIDTKPELEIYADDVKCSHGATVGQLDETALFYLRSRGLNSTEARRLLTQAFAAGILDSLAIDEVRDCLQRQIDARLADLLGVEA